MGSDNIQGFRSDNRLNFYPRPPHGERRAGQRAGVKESVDFYPRPPHGERRMPTAIIHIANNISIHAPRMGSDRGGQDGGTLHDRFLSTPPAWGATRGCNREYRRVQFLSTPPAWGATKCGKMVVSEMTDFYPRPPHGERLQPVRRIKQRGNFYPRPPHGERPVSPAAV